MPTQGPERLVAAKSGAPASPYSERGETAAREVRSLLTHFGVSRRHTIPGRQTTHTAHT
jgi:hypothetical protein